MQGKLFQANKTVQRNRELIMKNLNLSGSFKKFHNDEAGLEALQVVMILAVAAVALIVVKTQWDVIRKWFIDVMGQGVGDKNWQTK